jgi:hypothetical protein
MSLLVGLALGFAAGFVVGAGKVSAVVVYLKALVAKMRSK